MMMQLLRAAVCTQTLELSVLHDDVGPMQLQPVLSRILSHAITHTVQIRSQQIFMTYYGG